jgi:hypothetical protein
MTEIFYVKKRTGAFGKGLEGRRGEAIKGLFA